jgi:hypothetical protein
MGKRRFAATVSSSSHSTTADKYANDLTVWLRGWDHGVEIHADANGADDTFEIYVCGGSTSGRSNGRKLIGTVVNGEFIRRN